MVQRRLHTRYDVKLSAEVRHEAGVFTAVTRNLSVGGTALECDRPLKDGEALKCSLFLVVDGVEDERTPPLVIGGRVIWTAMGDNGSHIAGVRFESISAAQTAWLDRFLKTYEV